MYICLTSGLLLLNLVNLWLIDVNLVCLTVADLVNLWLTVVNLVILWLIYVNLVFQVRSLNFTRLMGSGILHTKVPVQFTVVPVLCTACVQYTRLMYNVHRGVDNTGCCGLFYHNT